MFLVIWVSLAGRAYQAVGGGSSGGRRAARAYEVVGEPNHVTSQF